MRSPSAAKAIGSTVEFPDWLPRSVSDRIRALRDLDGLDEASRLRLIRLGSDPRMSKVWVSLGQVAPDAAALADFLGQASLHPTILASVLSSSPPMPGETRRAFDRIADHARAILRELAVLAGQRQMPASGLARLEKAANHAALTSEATTWGSEGFDGTSLPDGDGTGLRSGRGCPNGRAEVIDLLRRLARCAELAGSVAPLREHRTLDAESVLRVTYIQQLSAFLLHRFGKVSPYTVAVTASVALNLADEALTEALVREITSLE